MGMTHKGIQIRGSFVYDALYLPKEDQLHLTKVLLLSRNAYRSLRSVLNALGTESCHYVNFIVIGEVVILTTAEATTDDKVGINVTPGVQCVAHCAVGYGPLTRYVKLRVAHAPGMPGTFLPPSISKETTS